MQLPFVKDLANGRYRGVLRFFYHLFYLSLASSLFFLLALYLNLFWLFGKMPTIDDLDNPKSEIASEIISADGKVIGKFFFENRSPLTFEEISPSFVDALIATEDVRFTRHSGIDARSMFRVLSGVVSLHLKGGGSTISQQLAKNLFKLRQDETYEGLLYKLPVLRTVIIKLKEWITAIKLERRYTKREIMVMYLNTIEYSSGAYGLKSAAKTYFKKEPKNLDIAESALLVGMIQNPSRYNPKLFPKRSKERRNVVIAQMVKYNKLRPSEGKELMTTPIVLNYSPESHNSGMAPYFRAYLKNFMKEELKKLGYVESDLYTKGFKIYTTIDSRMQAYAEASVEQHMAEQQAKFYEHWTGANPWVQRTANGRGYEEIHRFIEDAAKRTAYYRSLKKELGSDDAAIMKKMKEKVPMTVFTYHGEKDTLMSHLDSLRYYKHFLNIGFLAMDPRSGSIKAWVGGINFKYFKYDNVYQSRRQPGSSFKPFVYVTAIDNGFSTCDRVIDEPISFGSADGVMGKIWTPKNSDNRYSYRSLTLRQALGQSVNTVSARLIKEFKPSKVIEYAQQCGIKSELPNTPALCLGVGEVTLFELLTGYAVFANGGVHSEPLVVSRIEDKHGEVIKEYLPNQKPVLSKESAYKMIHLMRGATLGGGTSVGLSRYGILENNEVAAKTGTTSNYSDGWFMGMTQDLIAGVWVGGDDRAVHFRTMGLGQGARVAMPAWGLFMQKVYADPDLEYKKGKFVMPEGLIANGDCIVNPNEGFGSAPVQSEEVAPAQPSGDLKPKDDEELL